MTTPRPSRLALAVLAVSAAIFAPPAIAQSPTGRTMDVGAPAVPGGTAIFTMSYPASAHGNFYAFLWTSPPFAGSMPLTVPGYTVHGLALVDLNNFVLVQAGQLGASGTVSHTLSLPTDPNFLGYAWDLQTLDLAFATSELFFADNELSLSVSPRDMVAIPAGTFSMGSDAGPPDGFSPHYAQPSERPVHQVTISQTFCIGKYEVTQDEYLALMGSNPSYFQGPSLPNSGSQPVENVSWLDAMAYCIALTAQEAAAGRLPAGYEYRLPTEAEWEYCCRAGTTTEYSFGNSATCAQVNRWACGVGRPTEVGSYPANPWGLYDMHGNVHEWCLDQWGGTANYPSTAVVDPYVTSGSLRVMRGGNWDSLQGYCRSAFRNRAVQAATSRYLGFRVVLGPVLP